MKNKLTFEDPHHLTDEEIDNLCLYSGTYTEDANEDIKQLWRDNYRKVEKETNDQIQKAGSIEQWYASSEGRLL
jgi:hypothetical protein